MRAPRIDALVWRQDRGGRGAWKASVPTEPRVSVHVSVVARRRNGEAFAWDWSVYAFPLGDRLNVNATVTDAGHAMTMTAAQTLALARVPAVVRAVKALVKP